MNMIDSISDVLRSLLKLPPAALPAVALCLLAATVAQAGPGDLDTTFAGGTGYLLFPLGSSSDYGNGMALQADGGIVVAGQAYNGSIYEAAAARLTAAGALDPSFDSDGVVITPAGYSKAEGVAIQPDGKIVATGYAFNGNNSDLALARYLPNGALDTAGFGGANGFVTTVVASDGTEAYAVALQSDQKILVAGYTATPYTRDLLVARYESDGDLDPTFSSDGIVRIAEGSQYGENYGYDIAVQRDGKIVVVGSSRGTGSTSLLLVRLDAQGVPDPTFGGGDGIVTTAIGSDAYAYAVALQADGKIVIAGESYNGSTSELLVARYLPSGALDTATFGGISGYVLTPVAGAARAAALEIQRDGRIVAAGTANESNSDALVARYEAAQVGTETVASGASSTSLPGVTITNHTGGPCGFTAVKSPTPPGGAPVGTGEMPVQWTITSTCSPLNVDLEFAYSDDELANSSVTTEANLVAYKNVGRTIWPGQCSPSGSYTCTLDTVNNTLTVSGVTALSTWTLGEGSLVAGVDIFHDGFEAGNVSSWTGSSSR